jgi:hypothetical protein
MRNIVVLALAWCLLSPAFAENWVRHGTLQYDADSVHVDARSGLVHYTACMEETCTTGSDTDLHLYVRCNCEAGTTETYDPFDEVWTAPVKLTDETSMMLCAKKESLRRE